MSVIYFVSLIALFFLFILLSRKITRGLSFSVIFLMSILINFILWPEKIWAKIVYILTNVALFVVYYFIVRDIAYDFNGRIVSFKFLISLLDIPNPKKECRIIGRVLPYNNYQLKYNGKFLKVSEIATAGGTLVSGSSGSGKTYEAESLIKQNIVSGYSVIYADCKGDPNVVNEISSFGKEYGYEIFNLSEGKSDFNYDPLENINNTGRIEAIMNMRKWSLDGSDNHYKTGTQLLLQKLIGNFSHIYESDLKNKGESYTVSFYHYVKKYAPAYNEKDSYDTVSKLLELLITSSLNDMFLFKNGKNFSFKDMADKKFILIASFVSSNKSLATSFFSLLLRDMLDTFTSMTLNRNIFFYFDETGSVENPFIVKDMVEKGRSAKIAPTLMVQDINQFIIQANEAYLDSILGTINNFIIFNGATRNTAEKLASVVGFQFSDIENVIMNLRKPINGKGPTALYVSKYPTLNKRKNAEVFRFEPFIFKPKNKANNIHKENKINESIQCNNHDNFDENMDINVQNEVKQTELEKENLNYDDFI